VPAEGILTIEERLICSTLGAGQCRAMACNLEHRDLKILPWANVAAYLTRNGKSPPNAKGSALCLLPLPAEPGFVVHHSNRYSEFSANRRDIWHGSDMTGEGQVRSEWNRLLLWDVISPLYAQVLLAARGLIGPGEDFNRLWPTRILSDIWNVVRSRVYQLSEN
jgi:sacsin